MGKRRHNPPAGMNDDVAGSRVLILAGEFRGQEGVCLGKGSADVNKWAVSPDESSRIIELVFDKEFGLLIDLSGDPSRN